MLDRGNGNKRRVGGVKRNPPSVASSLSDKWVGWPTSANLPTRGERRRWVLLRCTYPVNQISQGWILAVIARSTSDEAILDDL